MSGLSICSWPAMPAYPTSKSPWIAWGPDAPTWSAADACLLRAVDELVLVGVIGDTTWKELAEHLDGQEILDVIFTAGSYAMLASMLDSLGIALDDDLRSSIATFTDRPTTTDVEDCSDIRRWERRLPIAGWARNDPEAAARCRRRGVFRRTATQK